MRGEVRVYRSSAYGPTIRITLEYGCERLEMTIDDARRWRDELIRIVEEAEKREASL